MNLDLTSLFPDLEALTPDGRWNMLQDWLSKNPEYGERAERWSKQSVDQVFNEIQDLTVKKYGPLALMAFTLPVAIAKVRSAIETLQACYRERAGQTEKEIKNVRKRTARNRQTRNAKQARDRD